MLVDGLSTPVRLAGGTTVNLGEIAMNQWQANIYTQTFFDANGNGVRDADEPGLTLVPTNIRFRDGSYSNFNNTDLSGNAGFNEIFPLFSWYVIETDTTRYKNTGTHVVYDAGGPADGTCTATTAPCGSSTIAGNHGEHRRAGSAARQPARTGRGLLRQCGLHRRTTLVNFPRGGGPGRFHRPHRSALGSELKAGRDSPARTRSSNSARSPSRPARTAASTAR